MEGRTFADGVFLMIWILRGIPALWTSVRKAAPNTSASHMVTPGTALKGRRAFVRDQCCVGFSETTWRCSASCFPRSGSPILQI